jgi:3',5'-cyclic AMP phosphodiesterase CpdA
VRLTGLKPGTTYHYRARSGDLASDVYSFKTAPAAGTKKWRQAVYGDSRSNPAVHRKVVEQIEKAGVDLILHTGDIVLNGKRYVAWRQEFFGPLGELAHSTPWVSTIGNHEADAERYFSYVSPPGNERYFSFDFGNAHIVCLDSNAWIEKGRDSKQYQWLANDLAKKRDTTWTFVVFHHALFSAHATRPINPLRWDWAPLLIDPANRVDAVLNGHDHFYARSYRLGRLADRPQPGVLFLTTAGGGAGLYRTRQRGEQAWCAELAVPRKLFADWSQVRVNVVHRRDRGKESQELHLCMTYVLGSDPDLLPDFRPANTPDRFARLVVE